MNNIGPNILVNLIIEPLDLTKQVTLLRKQVTNQLACDFISDAFFDL